ncbi:MAG TPA: single-stranded-DNA-specific exonuclease RecJ, partial [Chthonomonadales bacterium]|nr:single-stranded-DNA-specific exonuclease RecJ [Chthonomonadales bacterium]
MSIRMPLRWRVADGDDEVEARLAAELGIHAVTARLLAQRGLTTPEAAHRFLHPSLQDLHDPQLLPDADLACSRLKDALHAREKILIHGDYDGDGVTSAALWTRVLRSLGAEVDVFVPHRKRDGYDLRMPIIEQARQEGVKLIVTTDCGIQRLDEVEHARQYGIDVIVTDHHTPNLSGALPRAVAVVNPHRKDSRYPFPHLAGVGVSFRLCELLISTLGHNVASYRRAFLDLACIGTITDVMPLLDENRIMAAHGLIALQSTQKPGLKALIEASGFSQSKQLTARSVGFGLGPRLNAASRMDETQIALDLLLTRDQAQSRILADRLNDLNIKRREEQDRVFEEAMALAAQLSMTDTGCLVLSGKGWPGGVIGIVAGKVAERCHRPAVIIGMDDAGGRGSARSIHPFNIFEAIDSCKELLWEYGGHAHAAGFSLAAESVGPLAQRLNQLALEQLTEEDLQPVLEASMVLPAAQVSPELVDELARFAPHGPGNEEPCFVSRNLRVAGVKTMGKESQHLKLMFGARG